MHERSPGHPGFTYMMIPCVLGKVMSHLLQPSYVVNVYDHTLSAFLSFEDQMRQK